jgi:hypothetical protein
MNGWTILVVGAVCSSSALMFLQLAADAVAGARESLRVLENNERKALRLRQEGVTYIAERAATVGSEPPEAVLVADAAA